jgi:hypothetical protein
MSELADAIPDRGQPSEWVTLTTEETRCIEGLKKYYVIHESLPEQEVEMKAWEDLKREFERLKEYKWYKQ